VPADILREAAGTNCRKIPTENRASADVTAPSLAWPGSVLLLCGMRFRAYKNTDLTVSEVGFGLWTISTGRWGNFTEGEAVALMHKAFDLGVTLFDAA